MEYVYIYVGSEKMLLEVVVDIIKNENWEKIIIENDKSKQTG